MEPLLIYLLKASGILILFHAAYEFLLKKETFFRINRAFLLLGFLMALILPSVVITNYIELPATKQLLSASQTSLGAVTNPANGGIDLIQLLQFVFIIGIAILACRFLIQLLSVRKLVRSSRLIRIQGLTLVEIPAEIAPFSFFKYIFYNPDQFGDEELQAILEHEKIHCRQWHSLDILFAQLILILLWLNPVSWLYFNNIKQNLEFLADSEATERVASRKTYEYTMLKVSGNLEVIPITNNFYNSIIKKRIVMLHQSKSNKWNALKILIIMPVLALFLWSFNSRTIYVSPDDNQVSVASQSTTDQTIEIRIDKDTSTEELEELKKDLAKKGIDFSYTVVHNEQNEIIDLDISFSGGENDNKTFVGSSSFNNDGEPIDPVTIVFDKDNNLFLMNNEGEDVKIIEREEHISTWVHADDDAHQTIEIYKDNGKETIKVNGKEVSREEFEEMEEGTEGHQKKIKIKKVIKGDKDSHVMIMSDHDSAHEIEVISGDGGSFFFAEGELDEDWLILLNGKEVEQDAIKGLEAGDIETMNVIKGKKASKKYGNKAKEGVLEITTKN